MSSSSTPGGARRSVADSMNEMLSGLSSSALRKELRGLVTALAAGLRAFPNALPADPDELAASTVASMLDLKDRPTLEVLRMACESAAAQDLASQWQGLITGLMVPTHRSALGPFARYCQHRFIAPAVVDDRVLAHYELWLRTRQQNRWPRRTALLVARAWNAQAGKTSGWPNTKIKF